MKVIAISGGSCSGKSTLLNALAEKGYRVDDFKAARSVMTKLELTVDDLKNANEDVITRFQTALFDAKVEHDYSLLNSVIYDGDLHMRDDIVFVERSLADLMGFATLWHTKTQTYAQWLQRYRHRIDSEQDLLYTKVFLLPAGKFEYQNDGIRVDEAKQDFLDRIITMQTLESSAPYKSSVHIVDAASVKDRVDEIERFIQDV